MSVASLEEHHHHHQKKKRVGKACDLCRIKKTKCDGKSPCSRCVADNKICAFVHKKKSKDKVHPSGYIDMLETSNEILTKSLKKLILMSEPHLPFLQEIMESSRHEHSPASLPLSDGTSDGECYVPINEVVSYLGVVARDPTQSTPDLDARLPDLTKSEESEMSVPILGSSVKTPTTFKTEPESPAGFPGLEQSSTNSSLVFSADRLRMGLFSDAGFQTSSTQDFLNDMDVNPGIGAVDLLPRKSSAMFANSHLPDSTSQLPVSSLSHKFESHFLDEQSVNSFRRLFSSKSHLRRNSGHVHKPYLSHGSSCNFLANNASAKHHSLSPTLVLSLGIFALDVGGYIHEDAKQINCGDYFLLGNEKIMDQPPSQMVQNDLSFFLEADLLLSNPFLS